SSPRFSTLVGPGLHEVLPPLHPGHGEITPLRGHSMRLTTPCSDSASLRLPHNELTLPHTTTRRLILQKARHHNPKKGRSDGLTAHGFRYSFTTPHRGTFHLSLTVLVHYRSPGRILA